ncbi:hypothetical protein PQ610_03110 [Tardisphaera miroshnichenkoae]
MLAFAFTAWDFLKTPAVSLQSVSNLPYASISSAKVTSSGLYFNVTIVGSAAFRPQGGSAVIVETGQSFSLIPVGNHLYGFIPLSSAYLGMQHVGIEGVVQGSLFGAPSQIHFFSIVALDFSINVSVVGVSFSDGILSVNISSSSPVPVIIGGFYSVSLIDNDIHAYVFNSVGFYNESFDVPAGVHVITATFKQGEPSVTALLYSKGPLSPGNYTLYMLVSITYEFPSGNSSKTVQFYHSFEVI